MRHKAASLPYPLIPDGTVIPYKEGGPGADVLTLLKARFSAPMAIQAGQALWGEQFSTVIFLTPGDIGEAWRIFRTHADKGWSFTDCTSNAVMKRLRVSQAFSFDRHFSQMIGIRRVP